MPNYTFGMVRPPQRQGMRSALVTALWYVLGVLAFVIPLVILYLVTMGMHEMM